MSEGLSENRVLKYVVIYYMRKYFSVPIVCIVAPLYI